MEPLKLPAGYRLPTGTTMADVRRLDQELRATEGPLSQGRQAKKDGNDNPPKKK
jgi:hypothetical protein